MKSNFFEVSFFNIISKNYWFESCCLRVRVTTQPKSLGYSKLEVDKVNLVSNSLVVETKYYHRVEKFFEHKIEKEIKTTHPVLTLIMVSLRLKFSSKFLAKAVWMIGKLFTGVTSSFVEKETAQAKKKIKSKLINSSDLKCRSKSQKIKNNCDSRNNLKSTNLKCRPRFHHR